MRRFSPIVLAALMALPALAGDKTFKVDRDHTVLGFEAKTIFTVPGRFNRYKVTAAGDPDSLQGAKVTVVAYTETVDTHNKQRDEHLRTADFFDVEKFPKLTFESSKVWRENGKLMVQGSLEMHGVKKDVTIPFEEAKREVGSGVLYSYEGELDLNRNDWTIGQGIAAKIGLKDTVKLKLTLAGQWADAPAAAPAAEAKAKPAKAHKKG